HEGDFTFAEQRGTMALLFRAGINHINSYLSPERLGEDFPAYAAMFARAAYLLRGARFAGEIGVYYPIETAQGFYYPDVIGVNCGAALPEAIRLAERTLADLNRSLGAAGLDYTVIDADWVREAELAGGALSANGLEITALVMPAVRVLDADVAEKLAAFEGAGGTVLWTAAKPDGEDAALTEDPAQALRRKTDTGIRVEAEVEGVILVSPYEKDGRPLWYLVNNRAEATALSVRLTRGGSPAVWDLLSGTVEERSSFVIPAYSAVIVRG
ncbi:MAG: hypothetical protein K6A33_10545, partial [Clostridiales bacterium]|nr:hypothetical protein [Clostridiales bacterium]